MEILEREPEISAPIAESDRSSRRREIWVFLFLTVVLAPMTAAALVGAYGLGIWIFQMLAGPPTS